MKKYDWTYFDYIWISHLAYYIIEMDYLMMEINILVIFYRGTY